jgi:hypothetical protein
MARHETITSSGISIVFEDGEPDANGRSKRRCYLVDGEKLPSVTTILGMLDKPGLPWAAEKLTVAAAIELAREGELPVNVMGALSRMGARGLRFRQIWDQKAERGHLSHADLIALMLGEEVRPLSEFLPEERGFIQGGASWVADFRPVVHEHEQMVASVKHGFAGRPDFTATLGIKTLPDGSPAPRGVGLFDVKTSEEFPRTKPSKTHPDGQVRTPYPENLAQVGLYEVARRECGYAPTDYRAIVRLDSHGNYDLTVSWREPEDALRLLPAYEEYRACSQRVKTAADQRPVGFDQEFAEQEALA